ncbi:MAG TPA: CoA transferase [Gammaproteobacteria bacterium]|nr:CoA transferase [Gammaproteobacteria bacterium]
MSNALDGIRVLEIGVFIAAPFAALQLADLGADVTKVESLDGEPVRASGPFVSGESSPFLRLNRHKRSVALDLKSPGGKRAFLRLAATADVIVENLRPGALRALQLGYDDIRAVNPRVVYASASGFGQDGPLADRPGLDIMAQARGGLMSITGEAGGAPAKIGVPICDLVAGLYAALGIVAALRERDTSGVGQYLDVSLLESGVSLAVWEAGRFFATGEVGRPLGTAHQSEAPYQAVRSADGWLTLGAITPKTWTALCKALALERLEHDARFATSSLRHAHRHELIPSIEERTMTMSTAANVQRLEALGVPCAPIADYGQVFTDEHLAARNFFWDAPHPVAGPVRQLGSPLRLSRSTPRRGAAAPTLGADTRTVLREVGYSDAEIDALVTAGSVGVGK